MAKCYRFLASLTEMCSSLGLELTIQSKQLLSKALLSTMFVSQHFSLQTAEKAQDEK